jgi:hypothetical protein
MRKPQTVIFTFTFLLLSLLIKGQSPYRVFSLDANLKTDSEQQVASIVLKALVLNKLDIIKQNYAKIKPNNKIDWKTLQTTTDSLFKMLPADGEFSWEEDYGLRLDGIAKHERWKELTFYHNDFDASKGVKAIVTGKKKNIVQIRILIDLNNQIEDIKIVKGTKMINRDNQIFRSYNILYKPKKEPK